MLPHWSLRNNVTYTGLAAPFVTTLVDTPSNSLSSNKKKVIVDLSADHRFLCGLPDLSVSSDIQNMNDHRWTYGLPERYRKELSSETEALLVANPGCYATGAQMGLYPLALSSKEDGYYGIKLNSRPNIFGVSGYSGAGTTPSDKNNLNKLEGNLMPYSLTNHIHEREIGQLCGMPVNFMPHVGAHFRGITLTISVELDRPCHDANELHNQFVQYYQVRNLIFVLTTIKCSYYQILSTINLTHITLFMDSFFSFFQNDPLIRVMDIIPEVKWNAGGHHVCVGGFTVSKDGTRAVICVTIDNLLKGAATQALANGNLGLGLDELMGIHVPEEKGWELDNSSMAAAHNQFVRGGL